MLRLDQPAAYLDGVPGVDEAVGPDGAPRDTHAALLDRDWRAAAAAVGEAARARDLTHGAGNGVHPYAVDPVPRVIARAEWEELARGVAQRVRALDAFVADAHGARCAVRDGVVPAGLLREPWLVDAMRAAPPPAAWIVVAGPDVVRGSDGRLVVLEDNVRTPTMAGYACAAAEIVRAHVRGDGLVPADTTAELPRALRRALEATAPDCPEPRIVLLSDGARSGVRWELHDLAVRLGIDLAEPHELRVRGDVLVTAADGRRVDVLWRRTSEEHLHDPAGRPTGLHALLDRPVRTGRVRVANALGTGVADEKRAYAHVPDLIRYFSGEEPLLDQVPTYDLEDERHRDEALGRLGELVLKPRYGSGGGGVVVGPRASARELADVRAAVLRDPPGWIAQEPVALSTHPTVGDGGQLEPRHVDLRPYACWDGCGWSVPPAGYTRVAARSGELVVNSSRGGGGKDTWVV